MSEEKNTTIDEEKTEDQKFRKRKNKKQKYFKVPKTIVAATISSPFDKEGQSSLARDLDGRHVPRLQSRPTPFAKEILSS